MHTYAYYYIYNIITVYLLIFNLELMDFILHPPLNFLFTGIELSTYRLNLSIVNDSIGEDREQFEIYFKNIPSQFVKRGTRDTVCVTIQDDDGM